MLKKTFLWSVHQLQSNLSLGVLSIGAVSFLWTTILLKKTLSATDYAYYALFITFCSLVYLLGLLGTEQLLNRTTFYNDQKQVVFNPKQLKYIVTISITVGLLAALCFLVRYPINCFWAVVGSAIALPLLLLAFTILRLQAAFWQAQLVANFWKIALFFFSFYLWYFSVHSLTVLLTGIAFILGCNLVLAFFFLRNHKMNFSTEEISSASVFSYFQQFFWSNCLFAVFIFADRFLVEANSNSAALGDYFLLTNLVVAPFALAQNYIGFRYLVLFKQQFSMPYFYKKAKISMLISAILSTVVVVVIELISKAEIRLFTISYFKLGVFLLLLLGNIRLISGLITAAFEAQTSILMLQKFNRWQFLLFMVVAMLFFLKINNLWLTVLFFIFIWGWRTGIQFYLIKKYLNPMPLSKYKQR